MSEKRTVVQPTAPFGCLACGAGEGETHRVGCSHLRELNEALRTLSGAGAVSPGPGPGTPPAPTGEPGDPAQGPGGGAGAPGPDGVDSTAQADWRDSQPRLMSLGGPGPWDPQAVARLQESLKSQRRQPIIAVAGPLPEVIDRGTFVTVAALDELKGRVATLEAQAEAVGAGLSRCESSVAGMTTTHADRIETIEDDVRALTRAVLELRELGFNARHGASDQKLSILINGEPAPYSSFRIPEAADHVRCPRCGSDDPDRYIICTGGDTTEPYFKASCHYLKDSDLWHESAKAARDARGPFAVGAKRPTHARLVRAVERWVGGYSIPAGTVLEIIGWSSDYPRIANPAAPASHPAPWFILHPGEWEACADPKGRPAIVCLCGSTRFHQNFIQANERLTLEGKIVLSVGSFGYAKGVPLTEEQKVKLDELHKRKIDMADEVLVLNVGGYIGSSTRGEIQYAWDHGKRVTFLEPMDIGEVRSAVAWGEKGGVS